MSRTKLTAEEKKERARAASKKWYAAHKAKKPARGLDAKSLLDRAAELANEAATRLAKAPPGERADVAAELTELGFEVGENTVGIGRTVVWQAAARRAEPGTEPGADGGEDGGPELLPVGGADDVEAAADGEVLIPDADCEENGEDEDDDAPVADTSFDFDDPDADGRGEMQRELDAMGVGEEDE